MEIPNYKFKSEPSQKVASASHETDAAAEKLAALPVEGSSVLTTMRTGGLLPDPQHLQHQALSPDIRKTLKAGLCPAFHWQSVFSTLKDERLSSSSSGNIYTLLPVSCHRYHPVFGGNRSGPGASGSSGTEEAGGKGANTAAALAVQGMDCAFICLMGEENAGLFLHLLDDAGVRCVPSRCRGASGKISRWKHHRASTV